MSAKTLEDYQLENKVRNSLPDDSQGCLYVDSCTPIADKLFLLSVIFIDGISHQYLAYDTGNRFLLFAAIAKY